jgi:predicted DNA-binding transcriptional regulator YafY
MPTTKAQFDRYNYLIYLLSEFKLTREEISEKYEDKGFKVHWKTVLNDISYLIENGAEIHRPKGNDKRYYLIKPFSLQEAPFGDEEISIIEQCIDILSNTSGFHIANDLREVLLRSKFLKYRLEKNIRNYISFESHTIAQGTQYLDDLYNAIIGKTCLKINYTPNSTEISDDYIVSPYFLKEYRNRWYLLALKNCDNFLMNFALDRINSIRITNDSEFIDTELDFEKMYENTIGVTIPMNDTVKEIILEVEKKSAGYIKSKPLIKNQEILKENENGSIIVKLNAYINYELKQNILSYGDAIKVVEPDSLAKEISEIYKTAINKYNNIV